MSEKKSDPMQLYDGEYLEKQELVSSDDYEDTSMDEVSYEAEKEQSNFEKTKSSFLSTIKGLKKQRANENLEKSEPDFDDTNLFGSADDEEEDDVFDESDVKSWLKEQGFEHDELIEHAEKEQKSSDETQIARTQYFDLGNLSSKELNANSSAKTAGFTGKYSAQEADENFNRTRINLMENFRVLSDTDKSDKTILEQTSEDETKNLVDAIDDENCDDVFKAIDQEENKKKKFDGLIKMGEKSIRTIQKRAQRDKRKKLFKGAQALEQTLEDKKSALDFSSYIMLTLTVLSFIMQVLISFYKPDVTLDFMFANGAIVFVVLNIVLLISMCICMFKQIKSAVKSMLDLKFNDNVSFTLLALFALLQLIMLLFTKDLIENKVCVYTVIVGFAGFITLKSKAKKLAFQISVLKMSMKNSNIFSVQTIDNPADTAVFNGAAAHNNIGYVVDSQIPQNFDELNTDKPENIRFNIYFHMACIIFSFIIGVVSLVVTKEAIYLVTNLLACLCISLPIFKNGLSAAIFSAQNKKAFDQNIAVVGYDAIQNAENCDALNLELSNIFSAEVSNFKKVPKSKILLSDCVAITSSVLTHSKSIIAPCFDEYMGFLGIDIQTCDELEVKHSKGIKAELMGMNIIVGTREFLLSEKIEGVASEREETNYANGKTVLYVTVNEKIVATFLVAYEVLDSKKDELMTFANNEATLFLSHDEPCNIDDAVEKKLSALGVRAKVLNEDEEQIILEYKSNKTLHKSSGLLYLGKDTSVLKLLSLAKKIYFLGNLANKLYFLGTIYSLILVILAIIFNSSTAFNPSTIVALQLLWAGAAYIIGTKD